MSNMAILEWLETCESTSRVLKDRIKDGLSAPMALAAGIQTAGVGRLGRSWVSKQGNLHLSIALPPGCIDAKLQPLLPIISGVLVAEWIESKFGLTICLKWPNDLFLDGKKIGGILCEATYEGSEFRGVIIGIGINLADRPRMTSQESWDYLPGLLPPAAGNYPPIKELATDLTQKVLSSLKGIDLQDILVRWQRFAIKSGHEWVKSKTHRPDTLMAQSDLERRWDRGIDGAGQLQLERAVEASANTEIILVNSVANEYTWSLAKNGRALVADVGNSVTKLGVVTNTDKLEVEAVTAGDPGIAKFLSSFNGDDKPSLIHAISVNPEGLEQLRSTASAYDMAVREVQRQPVGLRQSKYDLNAIGMDRLAAIEAFFYLSRVGGAKAPAMIVSLGTATTVDIIDDKSHHLGGYIVAGLQTSLDAVSTRGRNLPKNLDLSDAIKSLAQDKWPSVSRDAMTHGAVQMTLSFLQQERVKLAKHCNVDLSAVRVYLTGGFSEQIKQMWTDPNVHADPGLALLGTAVLALNGR
jgi:BirA family biotin operon repressor/biotin-[acetyl-CoA-carboxylase] ligase